MGTYDISTMSDVEDNTVADAPAVEVTESTPAKGGKMSIEDALQQVLKNAMIHDGLARGLRECAKALDEREAHLCVLNESCTEAEYTKLIKVADPKVLGTWAGLCKIDRDGTPRKVVGCSCVVVKDYGQESEALNVLLDHFASR